MGEPPKPRVRRPSAFRQQDVARAIAAAQSRGLNIARVEVDPVTQRITLTMVMKDDNNTVTETTLNWPVEDPGLSRRKNKCHGSES